MKNLKTIGLFVFAFGAITLFMKLVLGRIPQFLSFLGEALLPAAIGIAALGAVLFGISFIISKKPGASGGNDDEGKKQE